MCEKAAAILEELERKKKSKGKLEKDEVLKAFK